MDVDKLKDNNVFTEYGYTDRSEWLEGLSNRYNMNFEKVETLSLLYSDSECITELPEVIENFLSADAFFEEFRRSMECEN